MIKKNKKHTLIEGDIFAVELRNKTFSIVQLCFIFETDGYLSLTFGLFDIREKSIDDIRKNIDNYNLSNPFIIATLSNNPIKEWIYAENKPVEYSNIDVKKGITGTWGWYHNTESGLYPKFESYFGILPWDLYIGKSHIENDLIDKDIIPQNIRYLKDFTAEEAKQLGIYSLIEYLNRVQELKVEI